MDVASELRKLEKVIYPPTSPTTVAVISATTSTPQPIEKPAVVVPLPVDKPTVPTS